MVDSSPHPNKETFVLGNNGPISTPTHIPKIGESSHLILEQDFEVTYDQLQTTWPITHQFARALGFLPVIVILLHKSMKKETTRHNILISLVEDLVIKTLEELVDPTKRARHQGDLPPIEEDLEGDGGGYSIF